MAVDRFDPADIVTMMSRDLGRNIADDIINRPAWQADGLCAEPEHATLPWVPNRGDDTRPCVAVCERCLVRRECRSYALEHPDLVGIWGGTTAPERRRLRAARSAA